MRAPAVLGFVVPTRDAAGTPVDDTVAYACLAAIADYLAGAEPHSPVPVLIRRAIGWGRMPFAELLEELTHNNNEMQTLLMRKPLARSQAA